MHVVKATKLHAINVFTETNCHSSTLLKAIPFDFVKSKKPFSENGTQIIRTTKYPQVILRCLRVAAC